MARACAQRHADSDFLRSLNHRLGHHAIDPDGREQQRHGSQGAQHPGSQSGLPDHFIRQVRQAAQPAQMQIGIDRLEQSARGLGGHRLAVNYQVDFLRNRSDTLVRHLCGWKVNPRSREPLQRVVEGIRSVAHNSNNGAPVFLIVQFDSRANGFPRSEPALGRGAIDDHHRI